MSNIQIITDSTAYFTKEYAERHNIKIVPLSVTFLGITADEGYPGEFDEFYHKLEASIDFPTTSQPSIEAFASVYQEAIAQGNEIITIVISEKLSGTFNSASIAANMIAPDKISVIDSESTSSNLKLLVNMAKDMAEKGESRAHIVNILEQEKKRMSINLTVETLEYLKRGGRLSGAQALIGSLLNVKPIIGLVDGKLIPVGKVRGKSKALELMISKLPNNATHISVCHIFNIVEAELIQSKLQERFKHIKVGIDVLGPVIGSHLGPKGIGICCKW